MDGAKMRKIENARRNSLGDALGDEQSLHGFEPGRIRQAQLVPEHIRSGIERWIAHSAARAAALPRIQARRRSCGQRSCSNISNVAISSGVSGLASTA